MKDVMNRKVLTVPEAGAQLGLGRNVATLLPRAAPSRQSNSGSSFGCQFAHSNRCGTNREYRCQGHWARDLRRIRDRVQSIVSTAGRPQLCVGPLVSLTRQTGTYRRDRVRAAGAAMNARLPPPSRDPWAPGVHAADVPIVKRDCRRQDFRWS